MAHSIDLTCGHHLWLTTGGEENEAKFYVLSKIQSPSPVGDRQIAVDRSGGIAPESQSHLQQISHLDDSTRNSSRSLV
jgi:hypothetical protein